ncbi:unnamed protein product [Phytophthora lilii]|uniref:Unnamed protein product n=1 Tax=Phytophthora lilii TaxID=2077276 RepID=A0A9W7CSE3_9STRA|nr:unnamed protein product [Phytophthora lilii]
MCSETDTAIPSQVSTGMAMWAVEGVAHSIFNFLDLSTFDAVLNFLQTRPEFQGYLNDSKLWTELSGLHFGGKRDAALTSEGTSIQDRDWDWTSRERTCVELQEFLQSADDLMRFEEVAIVEGDIEHITNIDGKPLDAIVFPTSSYLMNPHIGAAGAVFRRAGRGLEEFVGGQSFRDSLPFGPRCSAIVTPAFDAGVTKLIHCVGPSVGAPDCYELLSQTYENALNCTVTENLECVAMVSISTGNLGVPCMQGAQVAMRTIQKFITRGNWRGNLAIVCNDQSVLRAFQYQKVEVLNSFNVVPPLPRVDPGGHWFS